MIKNLKLVSGNFFKMGNIKDQVPRNEFFLRGSRNFLLLFLYKIILFNKSEPVDFSRAWSSWFFRSLRPEGPLMIPAGIWPDQRLYPYNNVGPDLQIWQGFLTTRLWLEILVWKFSMISWWPRDIVCKITSNLIFRKNFFDK